MQRANRSEGDSVGSAGGAASGGEQKGGFDEAHWDLTLPELTGEAQVEAAEPARGVGQAKIQLQ